MGIFWGLCSVIITSAAQLSLGFAMDNLPLMLQPQQFISAIFSLSVGAFALYAGLAGYLLSVICWHKALHHCTEQSVCPAQPELCTGVGCINDPARLAGNIFSESARRSAVHHGRATDDFFTFTPAPTLRLFIFRQS